MRVRAGGKRATRACAAGVCVCVRGCPCVCRGAPCTAAAGRTNPTGSQRAVTAPKWHAGAPTLTAPCPKFRKTIVFQSSARGWGRARKKDLFLTLNTPWPPARGPPAVAPRRTQPAKGRAGRGHPNKGCAHVWARCAGPDRGTLIFRVEPQASPDLLKPRRHVGGNPAAGVMSGPA